MARFTFSQRLGASPSESTYNGIRDDFRQYINSDKLTQDNVKDESIRFRHLKKCPVIIVTKDCGNAIWSSTASDDMGRDETWTLYRDKTSVSANTLELTHSVDTDAPGGDLVEFTTWFYPYSMSARCEVAPAVYRDGAWVPLVEHRRAVGIGCGFYGKLEQRPYRPDFNPAAFRIPFLQYSGVFSKTGVGQTDRPGTASVGGAVICTVTLKRSDLGGVTKFGMMMKLNKSLDQTSPPAEAGYHDTRWSRYDHLYLMLVARDN